MGDDGMSMLKTPFGSSLDATIAYLIAAVSRASATEIVCGQMLETEFLSRKVCVQSIRMCSSGTKKKSSGQYERTFDYNVKRNLRTYADGTSIGTDGVLA